LKPSKQATPRVAAKKSPEDAVVAAATVLNTLVAASTLTANARHGSTTD